MVIFFRSTANITMKSGFQNVTMLLLKTCLKLYLAVGFLKHSKFRVLTRVLAG